MNGDCLGHARRVDAGGFFAELSTQQYLHPHAMVASVLIRIATTFGLPLKTVRRGARRFEVDTDRVIGRLAQAELQVLVQRIHWSCQQDLEPAPVES